MNKTILIGRLTKEPELKTTASNISICNFTLAIDRRYTNAMGERETDFIPIVTWRKTAEFAAQYFKKGMRVAVVGYIQTRSWDDAEGKRHYATEVVADELEFADAKRESYASVPSAPGERQKSAKVPEVKPGAFDDGDSVSGDSFEQSSASADLPFDF